MPGEVTVLRNKVVRKAVKFLRRRRIQAVVKPKSILQKTNALKLTKISG